MSAESSRSSVQFTQNNEQLGEMGKNTRLKSVIIKDRKAKCPADDPTISISLGEEDTFSVEDQYSEEDEVQNNAESDAKNMANSRSREQQAPWAGLFQRNITPNPEKLYLEFLKPVNCAAVIQENELYEIEEEKSYCILCCFAGRFPGMRAFMT